MDTTKSHRRPSATSDGSAHVRFLTRRFRYRNRYVRVDGAEGHTYLCDWRGQPHLVLYGASDRSAADPVELTTKEFRKLRGVGGPIVSFDWPSERAAAESLDQLGAYVSVPGRAGEAVVIPPALGRFHWSSRKAAVESLERLGSYANVYVGSQIEWCVKNVTFLRHGSRFIRVLIIAMTFAAGLIPILSQLLETNGKPYIAPAWASVALAIAVGLIALDRYLGFSHSWPRLFQTMLRLEALQQRFTVDWADILGSLEDPPGWGQPAVVDRMIGRAQVHRALARARRYFGDVAAVMGREEATWERELGAALLEEESGVRTGAGVAAKTPS